VGLHRFFKRGERPGSRRAADADEAAAPQEATEDEDDLAARANDLSYSFGKMRPDEQRIAAVEVLTELRAAGKISEENFVKEKRRLLGGG
jgi:hypothetical protein